MKIRVFYAGEYPNGFTPMSRRLHYYMKAMLSKGVDVEIVMPTPKCRERGKHEGVPYSFVIVPQPTRFNKRKISREYAQICRDLAKHCDIVFPICGDTNYRIKLITKAIHSEGKKIVIEQNENPYSFFGGRLDFQWIMNINRKIFLKYRVPQIDGFIVISSPLFNLMSLYKNSGAEIVRIPILSDVEKLDGKFHKEREDNIPYILHAGTISEYKDGIIAIFEAFALAHKRLNGKIKFILTTKVGFPRLLSKINSIIKDNNLQDYVEFKGLIPKEELDKLRDGCTLAIINKPSNAQNDYNFPTKLSELLPAEVPVIVSNTGEMSKFFIDGKNVYLVEPNNVTQIADKIVQIIQNPDEAKRIAKNGRALAEQEFNYLNHTDSLYSFFKNVIS